MAGLKKLIPSKDTNPSGLHERYRVLYADGTPTEPDAVYLVLRLDKRGDDPKWTKACRIAARALAQTLVDDMHLVKVAKEIKELCDRLC